MDLANSGKVNALSNRLSLLRQAIELIDDGATIIAMTLKRPSLLVSPGAPPPSPPQLQPESESGPEEPLPPDDMRPGDVLLEDEFDSPGAVTISAEGLTYPPQMMATIRAQQVTQWQEAYNALAQLGVTNVPPLPTK